MDDHLLELFPATGARVPLAGLYLDHDLRSRGAAPFVYSNFVLSLDGRIALPAPETGLLRVPPAIANPRDRRLYLELAAQADVVLTTSRHLRAVAAGRHGELLAVAAEADLRAWRLARGLPPSPALAAVSESLDIPLAITADLPGPLTVLTGKSAPAARARALAAAGITVLRLPGATLDGRALVAALAQAGHRLIYSIAGPRVVHALCTARALHRLYLTHAAVLLGGERFAPLMVGPELSPPAGAHLAACHLDVHAPPGAHQIFSVYDLVNPTA
ncbi:MAG: RibD family protein [Thiohalomonadaceae bacterium]